MKSANGKKAFNFFCLIKIRWLEGCFLSIIIAIFVGIVFLFVTDHPVKMSSNQRTTTYKIGLRIGNPSLEFFNSQVRNENVADLARKMGYAFSQYNGQRLFGPPLGWSEPPPNGKHEVFIGNIPAAMYETSLVPILNAIGPLYQMRFMMNFDGTCRGFAFAMFVYEKDAIQACMHLREYYVTPSRAICVTLSKDRNMFYINNIPEKFDKYQVLRVLEDHVQGASHLMVSDSSERGTLGALLRFRTHRDAALARRFFAGNAEKLWCTRRHVIVSWEKPENFPRKLLPKIDEKEVRYLDTESMSRNLVANQVVLHEWLHANDARPSPILFH